jgi:hypothetical protein
MRTMWIDEAQDFEISNAGHSSLALASIPDPMSRMFQARFYGLSDHSEAQTRRKDSRRGKATGTEPPGKINRAADIGQKALPG